MKVTGGQRSLLARGYAKLQKRAISKKRKGGIKPHCQLCVSFALKTSITQSPILLDNPPPHPHPPFATFCTLWSVQYEKYCTLVRQSECRYLYGQTIRNISKIKKIKSLDRL